MDEVGSVEIVIKGGRPWGFTLRGGIESRSALTVAQIEPRGKADRQGALRIGDHVLKINDVQCFSLADATQLIDCAFRTLTVLVWRSKSIVTNLNGPRCESVLSCTPRRSRSILKEDAIVIRRTSSTSDKIIPRSTNKYVKYRSPLTPESNVTLTCNSHESRSESDKIESDSSYSYCGSQSGASSCVDRQNLNSSLGFQQDVFQTSDVSFRPSRSPRNLTKDSGYETSAQGDHDYVNVDWINCPDFDNHSSTILPIADNSVPNYRYYMNSPYSSSEERYDRPFKPPASSTCQSPSYSDRYEQSLVTRYGFLETTHKLTHKESGFRPRPIIAPVNKRTGSYSSLCSSSESLSPQPSKSEENPLRYAKSSLSLVDEKSKARQQSRSHGQQVADSCQFFASPVAPAKSTPNLHYQGEMVPLRANKKLSIYEELAFKSGFDFSPLVQRQPFWAQKNALKSHSFSKNVYPKPYSPTTENHQPSSLPTNCDKVKSHEIYSGYYSNVSEDPSFESPDENSDYTSLPPPVPKRESSLRFHSNTSHEKYPSWPANLSCDDSCENSVQSSGQRSSSWTEKTQRVKEANGSYSRPKSHYQISTQQLPPVQEKIKSYTKSPFQVSNESQGDVCSREGISLRNAAFNKMSENFSINSYLRKQTKSPSMDSKLSYANSPPEKDTVMPLNKNNIGKCSKFDADFGFRCTYSRPDSRIFGSYENIPEDGVNNRKNSSSTPLLDMLRSEKEMMSPVLPQEDKFSSDMGISTAGSDSSSEETLKWHGSCSDISSLNTCKRNVSPSIESECSTIYDELNIVSLESSVKSYSSSPSENSSLDLTNGKNQWQRLNSDHRSSNGRKNTTDENLRKRTHQTKHPHFDSQERNCGFRSGDENIEESQYVNIASLRESGYSIRQKNTPEIRPLLGDSLEKNATAKSPDKTINLDETGKVSESMHPVDLHMHSNTVSPNGERYSSNVATNRPSQKQDALASRNYQGSIHEKNPESWKLKAIQKQAVLSFYHRQKASEAKEESERKAPRSLSFTYSRENSMGDNSDTSPHSLSPTIQHDRKRIQSSGSFSQVSLLQGPRYVQSNVSAILENAGKVTYGFVSCSPTELTSFSLPSPVESNENKTYSSNSESENSEYPNLKVVQLNKDLVEQCSSPNSESEKTQKIHTPGRKALLKKIYNPNENAVVKVISSQGETLAKSVIEPRNRQGIPVVKPQVPPKRIQSDDDSTMVVLPVSSAAAAVAPAPPPTTDLSSLSLRNVEEEQEEDDEELRVLGKNCPAVLPPFISREGKEQQGGELLRSSASMTSSSPDLPLPPHPQNNETEVAHTDDPFPPPPDFLDFAPALQTKSRNGYFIEDSYICGNRLPIYDNFGERSHSSETHGAIRLQNIDSNTSVEIPVINGSRDQTEFRPYSIDSSPLYCAAIAPDAEEAVLVKAEKQGDCEEEAIYVNLDFRNRRLYHKLASEKAPKSITNTTHSTTVSVTNTATQTSDSTPSLQRKFVASKQVGNLHDSARSFIPDILGQKSSHTVPVTSSSYMSKEGLAASQHENLPYSREHLLEQPKISHPETCFFGKDSPQKEGIFLPLTSPYFTTSEPKAKLLTRYCQSFEKEWSSQFELRGQKEVLTESISKKLNILRLEQVELKEEMRQNEELGKDVTAKIEKLAKSNELQKYKVHVEELEKIIKLLMSLSGRLARAENALLILPENANIEEKSFLEAKRNKLSQQHDEAWHLKENIDRRSCQVSYFLHQYLSKEEYADYEHFIKMKSKLLMDAIEIDEKIKLGEEQLAALQGTFQVQQEKNEKVNSVENLTVLDEI